MQCATCGFDNASDAKFCGECGSPQTLTCPSCGTANPGGHKFCNECGTAITETPAPPPTAPQRSERRMVSVLFADIVGFTPLSESRDPEDVRAMLTVYFDRSREIIERFGGEVDKFIGDAVMAVWGAVASHEDGAERATRAALELVDMVADLGHELRIDGLSLRAGLLTGETSVGPGGNEKGLVVGDLVNTASRLQSIAEPGTVLVGEPTARLIENAIAVTPLGERQVKGKEVPVHPYQAGPVLGQRGGRNRADGIEPPFVGREDELRILKDQLHGAERDSHTRLVSIVGEAGIGKSRLVWELLKYIDGLAGTVYWHSGRSPSYGDGITYWALGEMIRERAGIAETDDHAKSRLKLRTAVTEYVTSEDDRQWMEPRLAGILGLADMPPGDRNELHAAVRTFFLSVADRGPTVMVFEDTHWADDGLIEFISELVERSTHHPILVVTLARPDLLERHPTWGAGRRNTLSITLAPLTDVPMRRLVTGTVPDMPDELVTTLVDKAGGIPLYAVEFVRMLLGTGDIERSGSTFRMVGTVEDLALPDSLQAVIGARLDRLDATAREIVQDAAVLGQAFTVDGLRAIRDDESLEETLRSLVEHELLEFDEDPRSPERGQYRFVQSVIREVAYGRLSREDRVTRHVRVAEHFASFDDDELIPIVANHYLAAHTASPEKATGFLDAGRRALAGAADRAISLSAFTQAHSLLREAISITDAPAESALLHERAARAAAWAGLGDESAAHSSRAMDLYTELGDHQGRLRSVTDKAFALNSNFRSDEARTLLEAAFGEIEEFGTEAEAKLGLQLARTYMLQGDHARAIEVSDATLPVAEGLLDPGDVLDGVITRATALTTAGRSIESEVALRGALAVADERGLQAQAIRALNNLAVATAFTMPASTLAMAEDLMERARRFGALAWLQRGRLDQADLCLEAGLLDEAATHLAGLQDEDLDPGIRTHVDTLVATLAVLLGEDTDGAHRRSIESATVEWADSDDPQLQTSAGLSRARLATIEGDLESAFTFAIDCPAPEALALALYAAAWRRDAAGLERCQATIASLPDGPYRSLLEKVARGAIAAVDGDVGTARRLLMGAVNTAADVDLAFRAAYAAAATASLLGPDDTDGARAAAEAAAFIDRSGAEALRAAWADGLPVDQTVAETA